MTEDSRQREQQIFADALAIEDVAEREAFLRRATGDDHALRERGQQWLDATGRSGEYFDKVDQGVDTLPPLLAGGEQVGDRIGPYKLLERLGEGGFGTVYVAQQEEPIRRRVAIKIIKLGMDTRQVIARFEAERQALALMEHPHIAKVLDAGATETGRPYFVMELIRGVPITTFCEEGRLSVRQRLELFLPICQAIQHAHQKGVIHRDIKPSNVLVTLNDGVPHPMVIDFGVAKAIEQPLTEKTVYTRFAQMIGTPAYMSPEQAEMSKQDVDTRSDVYSLGILLYELLTETTPFPEGRLREAGYAEIQRIICEEEPMPPSTVLSTLTGRRQEGASSRQDEPASSIKLVKGDLDWIVLKAIDKDRERRYETANGLAADLRRHLADEPVIASPPGALYQFSKFVRRHRAGVGASVAVVVTLLVGAGVATWQAVRATEAERLAEERLKIAEEASAQALKEKADKEAINTWLLEDLVRLASPANFDGPISKRGAQLTLKDAILQASETLNERFADQPLIEADLRRHIGGALTDLGAVEPGIENLRRSLALYQERLSATDTNLIWTQFWTGWHLGFNYSCYSRNPTERKLGEEGRRLMEEGYALSRQSLGPEHPTTLARAFSLGVHYLNQGDTRLAEEIVPPTFEAARRFENDDSDQAPIVRRKALNALHWLRTKQGRQSEARELAKRYLQFLKERPGAGGPDGEDLYMARVYERAAKSIRDFDRDDAKAEELFRRALDISQRIAGDGHPTQNILYELALLCQDDGRYSEAAELMRESMEISVRGLGRDHTLTKWDGRVVASIHARIGDWPAAAAEFRTQRERGIVDGGSLSAEMLVRRLAGDTNGFPELRKQFAEDFDQRGKEIAGFGHTLTVLGLPDFASDTALLSNMANLAITEHVSQAKNRDHLQHQEPLLQGMLLYRSGQLRAALPDLRFVAHNYFNRRAAALGRYYLAMALCQLGASAEAAGTLKEGNQLLAALIKTGDLDPPFPDSDSWRTLALALLARDAAEEMIHGNRTSAAVTKDMLVANRARWAPVHDLIVSMKEAARRQDYAAARDLFLQVRHHPEFELETALAAFPWLSSDIVILLVQAGARDDLVTYLRDYHREDTKLPQHYLASLVVASWVMPSDLSSKIKPAIMALLPKGSLDETSGRYSGTEMWKMRDLGIGLYRIGEYERALRCLEIARQSSTHNCSLAATAFASLAAWKLGHTDDARAWFEEAEEGLRIRIEAGNGVLDPVWRHLSLTGLALQEYRELSRKGLATDGVDGSEW